jgi:hypothetical protein
MQPVQTASKSKSRLALKLSRITGVLALLSLIAAWVSEFNGNKFLGLSTQHFFNDAIVFSLFSIAGILDTFLHSRNV